MMVLCSAAKRMGELRGMENLRRTGTCLWYVEYRGLVPGIFGIARQSPTEPAVRSPKGVSAPHELTVEVSYAIPDKLDRDGKNQESKNLVNGTDRVGA